MTIKTEKMFGRTYGFWKVKGLGERINGRIMLDCFCLGCHKTRKDVEKQSLLTLRTKSCGCQMQRLACEGGLLNDIVGKRYGRLVVLEYDLNRCKWKCQCDCGEICYIRTCQLNRKDKNGKAATRSCGCWRAEVTAKRMAKFKIGDRFGRLVIEKFVGWCGPNNDRKLWGCRCDCGNYKEATSQDMSDGNVRSCGCYRKECVKRVSGLPQSRQAARKNCQRLQRRMDTGEVQRNPYRNPRQFIPS